MCLLNTCLPTYRENEILRNNFKKERRPCFTRVEVPWSKAAMRLPFEVHNETVGY